MTATTFTQSGVTWTCAAVTEPDGSQRYHWTALGGSAAIERVLVERTDAETGDKRWAATWRAVVRGRPVDRLHGTMREAMAAAVAQAQQHPARATATSIRQHEARDSRSRQASPVGVPTAAAQPREVLP